MFEITLSNVCLSLKVLFGRRPGSDQEETEQKLLSASSSACCCGDAGGDGIQESRGGTGDWGEEGWGQLDQITTCPYFTSHATAIKNADSVSAPPGEGGHFQGVRQKLDDSFLLCVCVFPSSPLIEADIEECGSVASSASVPRLHNPGPPPRLA